MSLRLGRAAAHDLCMKVGPAVFVHKYLEDVERIEEELCQCMVGACLRHKICSDEDALVVSDQWNIVSDECLCHEHAQILICFLVLSCLLADNYRNQTSGNQGEVSCEEQDRTIEGKLCKGNFSDAGP